MLVSQALSKPARIFAGALLVVAIVAPLYILGKFPTLEWTYVFAFLIAMIGINLLTGFCGQISLGNSAFMAIGGYATSILVFKYGWSYLATMPVAAALAGLGGVLLGIPALKLRGLYLGLATFALAISMPTLIRHFDTLTGGSQGISLPPAEDPFGLVAAQQLTSEQWLYYLGLVLLVAIFLFSRALLRTDVGRAFKTVRESETAAVANGVSLTYYKTLAFGLSAIFAGVAGSLDAITTAYVSPDSFDVNLSLALVVGAVIGGLGTMAGPALGAIFVVWSPIYAQQIFKARPDIVYGVLLIALMYTMPQGIMGGFYRVAGWYLRQRAARRGVPVEAPGTTPAPVAGATKPAESGRAGGARLT
ncbi:MAG TPA: branched-chain amino acid ABC transporter permease [Candidatus Dormibacteraeota bacterium]|nr:branched-chain amino acid ABC transporter permease [Candidatus Dormibacteraeota bacterium]